MYNFQGYKFHETGVLMNMPNPKEFHTEDYLAKDQSLIRRIHKMYIPHRCKLTQQLLFFINAHHTLLFTSA